MRREDILQRSPHTHRRPRTWEAVCHTSGPEFIYRCEQGAACFDRGVCWIACLAGQMMRCACLLGCQILAYLFYVPGPSQPPPPQTVGWLQTASTSTLPPCKCPDASRANARLRAGDERIMSPAPELNLERLVSLRERVQESVEYRIEEGVADELVPRLVVNIDVRVGPVIDSVGHRVKRNIASPSVVVHVQLVADLKS